MKANLKLVAATAAAILLVAAAAFALSVVRNAVMPEPLAELHTLLDVNGVEEADLMRVIDGDTILVRLGDGSTARVRLLAVDAPESVSTEPSLNCEEGQEASDHLKEALPEGTRLWLSRDTSDTDKYGRLLRFCWLEEPSGDAVGRAEFAGKCLNARLVEEGWAQAKSYPPDTAADKWLHDMGEQAAAEGLGVSAKWAGDGE